MKRLKKIADKEQQHEEQSYDFGKYSGHMQNSKNPVTESSESEIEKSSQSESESKSKAKAKAKVKVKDGKVFETRRKTKNNKQKQDIKERVQKRINRGKKQKMEKRQRADQILKRMQEQLADNAQQLTQKQIHREEQTCIDVPDFALASKKDKKSNKNVAKIKNKFFNNLSHEEEVETSSFNPSFFGNPLHNELEQIQNEYKQLAKQKDLKNKALLEARRNKLSQRVDKIKGRLEFKNAHEDQRFIEHVKKRLDDVKDFENIQLVVEHPKIFKGSSARYTDGAIYLKNIASQKNISQEHPEQKSNVSNSEQKEREDSDKKKKIDRNMFYSQFGRDLKEMKAIDYEERHALFKKSSLDQLQAEFEKNEHLFKDDSRSRSFSKGIRESMTNRGRRSEQESSNNSSRRSSNEKSVGQKKTKKEQSNEKTNTKKLLMPIQPVKQDNEESKKTAEERNDDRKDQEKIKQQTKSKRKVKKQLRKKKQREQKAKINQGKNKRKIGEHQRKFLKGLFEEEAEDSDDGIDNGLSSDEEEADNELISEIIDHNKVRYIAKNEKKARQKYIQSEYDRDVQEIRRIKQKLANQRKIKIEENSESRKRREMRITLARKKFEEEDGDSREIAIPNIAELCKAEKEDPEKNEDASQQIQQFEKKLKDLEQQIVTKKSKDKISLTVAQQRSLTDKDRNRKKTVWKDVKSIIRVGAHEKRGGFGSNDQAIAGGKAEKRRRSSKGEKKKTQILLE